MWAKGGQRSLGRTKKRYLGTPNPSLLSVRAGVSQALGPHSCLSEGQGENAKERRNAAGGCEDHGGREAYITDLVLGLLDSLEFRGVCHYAEAFALVLLKLLLVAHLEDQSRRKTRVKPWGEERGPQPVSASEAAISQERDPGQESSCSGIYPHDPTQSRSLNQKVLD